MSAISRCATVNPTDGDKRVFYKQFLFAFLLVAILIESIAAQDLDENSREKQIALRNQAIRAMQSGASDKAIDAANALLRLAPEDARTLRLVGDVYLRSGNVDGAVKQFDRYLKLEPDALPGLWQRGIALYFAGKYQAGAEQFEEHRRVNPNDVENAAWHFLCVAKTKSVEQAQKLVLPAPNDPRIPMEEVLQMLNQGDTETVIAKMASVPKGSAAREDADFYGNFYLGLYADAGGDQAKALQYLKKSAKGAPHHYMGDIARVYSTFLQEKSRTEK